MIWYAETQMWRSVFAASSVLLRFFSLMHISLRPMLPIRAHPLSTRVEPRCSTGFSLIELLVVVAIVAILGSIALPMYSKYVQRGDLVEAIEALTQYRVQMEQAYQDSHTYGNVPGCSVTPPTLVNFTISCVSSSSGQAYLATATGSGPVLGANYTIDQANNQKTLSMPASFTAVPVGGTVGWITR